jgi:hypothetical protein
MDIHSLNETAPWEWPEEAGEIILDVLKNKNAGEDDRILAAELAGDESAMNDEMAVLLLSLIGDENENESVRCNAAISLGPALEFAYIMEFDDPDDIVLTEETFLNVEKKMEAFYNDPDISDTVRRHVLEASVRSPKEWHKEKIKEALAVDDNDWKLTAVFGMGHLPGFEKEILETLESTVPEIHLEAVYAAGRQELEEAWPHIKELLNSDEIDKDLLLAAINVSASVNPGEAWGLLSDFADSEDEDIADAAEEALNLAHVLLEDGEEDDEDY